MPPTKSTQTDDLHVSAVAVQSPDYSDVCQWTQIVDHGQWVAFKTPADVHQLVLQLAENKDYRDISLYVRQRIPGVTDEQCEASINLAARLLLMLRFGVVKFEPLPRRYLVWNEGTLKDAVDRHFSRRCVLSCDRVKLPKAFNAWSIETIGGIQIGFTDNLADHLLLVEDDTRVLIFHHVSFLECHRMSRNSLLPPELAKETLDTLALLFPIAKMRAESSWFRRKTSLKPAPSTIPIDERLVLCGSLQTEERQIERFYYWRDRLVIVKQAYDEANPTLSPLRWWRDRRNGPQWCTFWVATLVLLITTVLGVVQCVLTGIQTFRNNDG
ncbi:hypothetical protein V8F20_009827 [Naviculisporaceae sp. PSN 640]